MSVFVRSYLRHVIISDKGRPPPKIGLLQSSPTTRSVLPASNSFYQPALGRRTTNKNDSNI